MCASLSGLFNGAALYYRLGTPICHAGQTSLGTRPTNPDLNMGQSGASQVRYMSGQAKGAETCAAVDRFFNV